MADLMKSIGETEQAVGMFQYIAPTITLILATIVYREHFTTAHGMGFGLVWAGLGLFTFDSVRRARSIRRAACTDPSLF